MRLKYFFDCVVLIENSGKAKFLAFELHASMVLLIQVMTIMLYLEFGFSSKKTASSYATLFPNTFIILPSLVDDSELLRLVPTTRTSSASLAELGKDSPTQLRLLGHNLMEGLLGDSPPSSDDAGRERLINALNLLSPTNHATVGFSPFYGNLLITYL